MRAGFDQHQLHYTGIHAKPIQCALLVQLVEAADAIVRRCVAQIQKVMGADRRGLRHGFLQPGRLASAAHQREVFDEAVEGFLRHDIRPRIDITRGYEMALRDIDEGIRLQTP